jgi:hypothetical protein
LHRSGVKERKTGAEVAGKNGTKGDRRLRLPGRAVDLVFLQGEVEVEVGWIVDSAVSGPWIICGWNAGKTMTLHSRLL